MARQKNSDKEINIVSRNIRKYREQLGMEQKELSQRLGVASSAVSNWETGFSKPNLDVLVPVCRILGITLYELFGVDDPRANMSEQERLLVAKYHELSEGHRYAVDNLVDSLAAAETMDSCPELTRLTYFSRQLAAGIGDPTDLTDEGEPIYLYSSELVNRADYVFTVNGSSMEPEYHNGDMVLISRFPECSDIRAGEVGAFIKGNEAFIKEFQRDGLHSFNKRYKTIHFTEEDKVFFIGKVIGILDDGDIASDSDVRRFLAAHESVIV